MKKFLFGLLVAAGLAYLSAAAWLYKSQRSLLYYPRPLTETPQADSFAVQSQGISLRGWVINPGNEQALLYFGGNGETVERDADFFRNTLPGISVYLIPYRGYGGNPGSPTESALYADALNVYDHIAKRHSTVDLMGRSLGSGIAVYVASKRPVAQLILATPYDSIQNIAQEQYPIFPMRLLLKDKFESWRHAPLVSANTLVLIGADDQFIPRADTDHLISQFRARPKVVVIAHADHNTISRSVDYADAIRAFLDESPRGKTKLGCWTQPAGICRSGHNHDRKRAKLFNVPMICGPVPRWA